MKSWSEIPNEILNLVTIYCGRDCIQVKWMFVNKRWFTFYLSQVFSTIKTSLRNEPYTNKILYSPFDIGKYAKCVHLSNIQKPRNLNDINLSNDLLGMIMKRTLHVQEVCLFQTNKDLIHQDWLYFSVVLTNSNCWKLQFLPSLGENNIFSAAYYYTCAYHSRNTLKDLELSFGMIVRKDFNTLTDFTALETLEVHKNLIDGFNDLQLLLQFTPNIQELTVRFSTLRSYQAINGQCETHSSIKKLCLYNFTPQNNYELLTLVKKFPVLENLCIFGESDKAWLGKIDNPLTIDKFFSSINSIHKYEIMMSGDTQILEFSRPWLESIKSSKQDVHLLYSYNEQTNQNHLNFQSNAVATFYGGSAQSTLLLKYTMMTSISIEEIIDKLKVLDYQSISCFRIAGTKSNLETLLKQIIATERTYLKKLVVFDCIFKNYVPRANTTPISQHITRIIFFNCKIDLLPLKSFLKEFKSLDYVEFDSCTFGGTTDIKSIDMSDTDIKTMKMINFQKFMSTNTYTDRVPTVITIRIYFAASQTFRYFSAVENNLFETSRHTCEMFRNKFNINEGAFLNIRVKTIQELSLMLTKTSKMFILSLN
ncbi:hypothetical protein EDC94DRAFT_603038 [Helicostylum pulchrum]|nr:hypothetical protein EDC94DRAFT_603038 [Helicostylum pulchrum]